MSDPSGVSSAPAARSVPVTFSIVGVQKAATSTLYTMLRKHRLIARGPSKERHYFDDERRDWTTPDHSDYVIETDKPIPEVGCDATPIYLFWPHALERMRAYSPQMQLIASFRDPIERAFSQWSMERGRNASFPDFSQACRHPHFTSLPTELPAAIPPGKVRSDSIVARGLYGRQLRRALDLFAREQWFMIDFRTLLTDHVGTLDRLTDFLGIHRYRQYPALAARNRSPRNHSGAPPTGTDVTALAELYADDLSEFHKLSGIDISAWPTKRIIDGDLDPAEFAEHLGRKGGLTT